MSLDQLNDAQIVAIGAAYEALRDMYASDQQYEDEHRGAITKTFGPAGAAKALYAIRPNACSPWDKPIRERLGLSDSGDDYARHLLRSRAELAEVMSDVEPGFTAAMLPELVDRPDSSPVKLVDEHDWVRYSRRFEPPSPGTFAEWAKLAMPPERSP